MTSRRFLILGLVCAALVTAGGALWWAVHAPPDPLGEAAARLGPRPVQGRLGLLPGYAPWSPEGPAGEPGDRGAAGDEEGGVLRGSPRRAILRLDDAARRTGEPEALREAATGHLLAGDPVGAVGRLERAVRLRPGSAPLWSDLTAARLALAYQLDRPFDLVRALAAAERAVWLDRDLPEAAFNRALTLGALHLDGRAELAWSEVVRLEPADSGWRTEAGEALDRLATPTALERWPVEKERLREALLAGRFEAAAELVELSPAGARDEVGLDLLVRWARSLAAGRQADAIRELAAARSIADRLAEIGSDRLLSDAVAGAETASQAGPLDSSRDRLIAGLTMLGEGLDPSGDQTYREAEGWFIRAEEELAAAGSPLAGWARYRRAICVQYLADYDGAERLLTELRSRLDAERYPVLGGLTAWLLGYLDLNRARPAEPFGWWGEAIERFRRAGDVESVAAVHGLFASGYDLLGRTDEAWRHRLEALDALPRLTSLRRAVSLLGRAGDAAADAGEPSAVLPFHDEAVAIATAQEELLMRLGASKPHQESLLVRLVAFQSRGRVRMLLGDPDSARTDLAAARDALARMTDADLTRAGEAEILSAEGELPPGGDPREAIAAQSRAIDFFAHNPRKVLLADAYASRGRAHRAAGDQAAAEADFLAALAELEQTRAGVAGEGDRIAFFALYKRQRLVDDLVELAAGGDDPAGRTALAFSERGRARALLDHFERREAAGGDRTEREAADTALERLPAELPADTAMVVYQALDDRLLAWVVRADRTELLRLAVGTEALADRVESLRAAMTADGTGDLARDAAADLYDLVLAAPLAAAGEVRHVVVVPDKTLHLLPFAALYDRGAGEYLLERVTVSLAPSIRVYLRALDRSRAAGSVPPSSVLAIGDPVIDRDLFPGFPSLTAGRREAEQLARSYGSGDLLLGAAADRATVLSLAGRYEVLHLATHALANPESAHGAVLLLAPSDGSSGALYASEIAGLDLSGVRLVVLAACDTGRGPLRAGEGVLSLARGFLAAGVPAVVQSLWAVDDRTASELLLGFHRELLAGADPATALRAAQLRFLHHPDPAHRHPAAWGAWAVVGGVE